MAVTVLVPHEIGGSALAHLDGVTALHYRHDVLPPGAEAARVLIPDFPAGADTVALAHRLPELGLVQLLTAGADGWAGALPDGCCCRMRAARTTPGWPNGFWER